MSPVQRLDYNNRIKKNSDFEIRELQQFLKMNPSSHLTRDYRLNFWIMIYITEGKGSHFIDFIEYPYKAGDLLIMQKNQVTHFNVNALSKGYILLFNEPFFLEHDGMGGRALWDFFSNTYLSPVISVDNSEGSANRTIMELIHSGYMDEKVPDREAYLKSLVQSLILSFDNLTGREWEFLRSAGYNTFRKFKDLLEENYTTKKTVDDYAEMMNVTKKTINSATRKVLDLSAKEVIIQRIILEIKRHLSLGELLTYEISDALGFDEPSNMTKFFKRYTGTSPTEFKDSL